MPPTYEWDEGKRRRNLTKHRLDFTDAWRVHEAPDKMVIDVVRRGEARQIEVAAIDDGRLVLALICTRCGNTVRCISLRRASRIERRMFIEWQATW